MMTTKCQVVLLAPCEECAPKDEPNFGYCAEHVPMCELCDEPAPSLIYFRLQLVCTACFAIHAAKENA